MEVIHARGREAGDGLERTVLFLLRREAAVRDRPVVDTDVERVPRQQADEPVRRDPRLAELERGEDPPKKRASSPLNTQTLVIGSVIKTYFGAILTAPSSHLESRDEKHALR